MVDVARSNFETWESALDYLDEYASRRKEELDQQKFGKGLGLIKSYMLETAPSGPNLKSDYDDIMRAFHVMPWKLAPMGENGYFRMLSAGELAGFVEIVSSRHLVIHSFQDTRELDRSIQSAVKESSVLDYVWLSPGYLNLLWELIIREQMPNRFVAFKFEHEKFFEGRTPDDEEDYDLLDSGESELGEGIALDKRASNLAIGAPVRRIADLLPDLQEVLSDFRAIKMLRFPAPETRGGYDFWDWGKITYRAPRFRDGRDYLLAIVEVYQKVTSLIEQRVWFQAEPTHMDSGIESVTLTGTPVSLVFSDALPVGVFHAFLEMTFQRGQGPFRLWGNLIPVGRSKFHVYGIDLHLWQRMYMEFTPERFIFVLPQGTCGNTVHRLVSNIQRYLSPDVQAYIGETPYESLFKDILLRKRIS